VANKIIKRHVAAKLDFGFYPAFDLDYAAYCVVGDVSGFAYASYSTYKEAAVCAISMQREKEDFHRRSLRMAAPVHRG
jgi:hypothetical protein